MQLQPGHGNGMVLCHQWNFQKIVGDEEAAFGGAWGAIARSWVSSQRWIAPARGSGRLDHRGDILRAFVDKFQPEVADARVQPARQVAAPPAPRPQRPCCDSPHRPSPDARGPARRAARPCGSRRGGRNPCSWSPPKESGRRRSARCGRRADAGRRSPRAGRRRWSAPRSATWAALRSWVGVRRVQPQGQEGLGRERVGGVEAEVADQRRTMRRPPAAPAADPPSAPQWGSPAAAGS